MSSQHHTIDWRDLPTGNHRLSCPACGRGKRDKTLGATVDHDGNGVAHCFRCEFVETYRPSQPEREYRQRQPQRPVRVEQVQPQRTTLSEAGRAIWRASRPITADDVAGYYLTARRCVLPPPGSHLRWLPAHRHFSGYSGPALVALLTDATDGTPRNLHFTWVKPDGKKADVDPPRLLFKGHRKAGAVCRLWPDEAVTAGLGVAEGIETALSLAHAFQPVWACIDAGNLAQLPVLPGVGALVVAQDRDPAGERAARECAARWVAAGCEVAVTGQNDNDINDVAQTGAGA